MTSFDSFIEYLDLFVKFLGYCSPQQSSFIENGLAGDWAEAHRAERDR